MMTDSQEIVTMYNLTGFQRDLLRIAANEERPSGQQIARLAGQYYEGDINHGRLYPNLDSLISEGLMEKGSKDQRTNFYKVTPEGHAAIAARDEWNERHSADHEEARLA